MMSLLKDLPMHVPVQLLLDERVACGYYVTGFVFRWLRPYVYVSYARIFTKSP